MKDYVDIITVKLDPERSLEWKREWRAKVEAWYSDELTRLCDQIKKDIEDSSFSLTLPEVADQVKEYLGSDLRVTNNLAIDSPEIKGFLVVDGEPEEDDHEGMIYNEYTKTWSWL